MKKLKGIDLRIKYNHEYTEIFNKDSFVVPRMYWWYMGNYFTTDTDFVNIIVSDDWTKDELENRKVVSFEEIKLFFDFNKYFKSDDYNKKKMQLDIIHKGMVLIAKDKKWSITELIDSYNTCLAKKICFDFNLGKLKLSPNKEKKLGVVCKWNLDYISVYWIITDKAENVLKKGLYIKEDSFKGV